MTNNLILRMLAWIIRYLVNNHSTPNLSAFEKGRGLELAKQAEEQTSNDSN